VLFFDLVSFTPLAAANGPADVVHLLSEIFGHIDSLVERHEAEKIETVGDAYMAVAGLSGSFQDHAAVVAGLALDIRAYFKGGVFLHGQSFDFRIGISNWATDGRSYWPTEDLVQGVGRHREYGQPHGIACLAGAYPHQ
jgi:adenylate cyclase